jgi:hypothetical protein
VVAIRDEKEKIDKQAASHNKWLLVCRILSIQEEPKFACEFGLFAYISRITIE